MCCDKNRDGNSMKVKAFHYTCSRRGCFMPKYIFTVITAILAGLLFSGSVQGAPRLQEAGEKTVIVIDPGHGGENRGTIENGHEEKFMTMTTALAMYEELNLFDDVEVYLTHTEDVDISLKKRAEFAQSVEADFLFSVHYNASLNHELFGSEVWVSSVYPYNNYGYQFGYEFLSDMRRQGLLVRGVKTRLGDGGADYYGIIRESVALGIPAVILEHCHVDEARDEVFCDTDEKLQAFGKNDAHAVARYFGLKSTALNVDYSEYSLAEVREDAVVEETLSDNTEPELCLLDFSEADYEAGTLSLTVSAIDDDSPLLYYSYSLDGGQTFSPRQAWPESDTLTGSFRDSFLLELTIPPATVPEVIVRAYNMYDLYTESNPYISPQEFCPEPTPEPAGKDRPDVASVEVSAGEPEIQTEVKRGFSYYFVVMFCLLIAFVMLVLIVVFQYLSWRRRKTRRLQQRKEEEASRNQLK